MLFWKVKSENLTVASLRYRCLLPVKYLALQRYQSIIYSNKDEIKFHLKPKIIIFVKSFSNHDYQLAQQAKAKKIPIILDLCDNIFADGYAETSKTKPADNFRRMVQIASMIITTGVSLKSIIEDQLTLSIPVHIIPDANETITDFESYPQLLERNQSLKQKLSRIQNIIELIKHPKKIKSYLDKFRSIEEPRDDHQNATDIISNNPLDINQTHDNTSLMLDATTEQSILKTSYSIPFNACHLATIDQKYNLNHQEPKQIIWFGTHGVQYGQKLFKLLELIPSLIEVQKSNSICLHIVCEESAYPIYQKHFESLPIPTKYTPWTQYNSYHAINQSHVTLIPNSLDPFDICKSPNRAILSLSLGVPVVATKTPALSKFENCLFFEDWANSINTYLNNSDLVYQHLSQAQSIIHQYHSGEAIADSWRKTIHQMGNQSWQNSLLDRLLYKNV